MQQIQFAGICESTLSSLVMAALFVGAGELGASPDAEPPAKKGKGQLAVKTIPEAPEALPTALRVTFKNTETEPLPFTEPRTLCAEALEESPEPQFPVLGIQLVDEKGLESQFPPVLTEVSKANLKKPRTVTLKPGQTWSKEYPLTAFHPWGPCGPAAPFPELFKPGSTPVQCSVFLFSGDGSRLVSNSFAIKVKVPKGFFESPSVATSEEDVDELFELMRNSPEPPGEPAKLSELISQLGESPFDLRLYAAIEIGKRGEKAKEAIPALVKLLKSADARDRLLALHALQEIGPSAKDALPALKQLGEDKSPRIREKAEEAMAAIEGKTLPSPGEPTYAGKPVSYWIAAATRKFDLKRRKERAASGEEDDLAEEKAQQALIRLGAKAAPYLIEGLKTEDRIARRTLASILGELRERGEVSDDLLVNALRNDSVQVRRGAAQALGESSFEESEQKASDLVVAALGASLKDPDLETQVSAARALGQPGLKSAVPALVEALEGSNVDLRRAAVVALGRIGPEASPALPALKGLLDDKNALVRGAARRALKELAVPDPEHVDFLKRMQDYLSQRTASAPLKKLSETDLMRLSWDADGIFFVVDRSGSSEQGLQFAKRYMASVVKALGPESQFGIVLVDNRAVQHPAESTPARADGEGKEAALSFIDSAKGGSGSCPLVGFQKALDFAEKSTARRKVIVYIGDGGGTCGGVSESDYLEHTFETIAARNQGKVEIHALGVGTGGLLEGFLLYLSEKNGGTYTRLIREE
jgi:HEAT repeat protein